MRNPALLLTVLATLSAFVSSTYLDATGNGLSDAQLLREMVARMGNGLADPANDIFNLRQTQMSPDEMDLQDALDLQDEMDLSASRDLRDDMDFTAAREIRDDMDISVPRDIRDEIEIGGEEEPLVYGSQLAMHPSLRDREYLSHSHVLGNVMAHFPPGSSYGTMRIKPSNAGTPSATTERKTDGVLPAYCNPPNPCPLGYTESDGCQEQFQNTAAFSRNYQGRQQCMCDTEHMFDCPDTSRETQIGALARSIQNQGALDSTLDRIIDNMKRNPYLQGEKLPIAAKKGVLLP